MMRFFWPPLSVGLLWMLCGFTSAASDLTHMPEKTPQPLPVAVSLSILDIQGIRENLNIMAATIQLREIWQDPRLAFDPIREGVDRLIYANQDALLFLEQHWNPRLVIPNLTSTTGTPEVGIVVQPDGTVTEIRTLDGGFSIHSDYSDFPFDQQSFPIDIASDRYDRTKLILLYGADEKASSTISRTVHLAQWSLLGLAGDHYTSAGWDGASYEHLIIHLIVGRKTLQYAPQIFLPYLFIMLAPLLILVIRVDDVFQKATMLSGAALATIALQFSVGTSLPEVVLTDNIVSRMFWFAYGFLVVMLLLSITIYNTTLTLFKDRHLLEELRVQLNWIPAALFLVLLAGTIFAPMFRRKFS
jgi:hypothetical protein